MVEGSPIYLIYKGRIDEEALEQNRISINEVVTEMRIQGIGSIDDVYYGILEQNGKLSLIDKQKKDSYAHTLIIDGEVNEKTLEKLGYDRTWPEAELTKRGLVISEVFLMSVRDDGYINIIRKKKRKEKEK
jgi:uncharacterized membrane protein YcaP (DUF421 family)